MKFKTIITIYLFSMLSWGCLSAQPDKESDKIFSLIKVDSLNEKTIVVSLGYDAVTAIATQKGIVVIDAGISNSLTTKYRKVIENKFKRNDFSYLINTHGHSDHIGGNQVFADVPIVGHINAVAEIEKEWKNKDKIKMSLLNIVKEYDKGLDTLDKASNEWRAVLCQKIRYQSAYYDLLNNRVVTIPTNIFSDSLNISLGDVTLNIISFGKAHSESDIIIHIPELKLLFTGDLFSKYGRPSIDDIDKNNCDKWGKVIQWIFSRKNKIDVVVGGHGQIMAQSDLNAFIEHIQKKMN